MTISKMTLDVCSPAGHSGQRGNGGSSQLRCSSRDVSAAVGLEPLSSAHNEREDGHGMGLLNGRSNGSAVDIRAFMDSNVPERIGQLVSMGLLVSIGTTRDRGAVSLMVTHDGDRDKDYFRDAAEAVEWLDDLVRAARGLGLGDLAPEPPAIQKPSTRSRKAT